MKPGQHGCMCFPDAFFGLLDWPGSNSIYYLPTFSSFLPPNLSPHPHLALQNIYHMELGWSLESQLGDEIGRTTIMSPYSILRACRPCTAQHDARTA